MSLKYIPMFCIGGGEIIKEENYVAKKSPDSSIDQVIKNDISSAKESHVSSTKNKIATVLIKLAMRAS